MLTYLHACLSTFDILHLILIIRRGKSTCRYTFCTFQPISSLPSRALTKSTLVEIPFHCCDYLLHQCSSNSATAPLARLVHLEILEVPWICTPINMYHISTPYITTQHIPHRSALSAQHSLYICTLLGQMGLQYRTSRNPVRTSFSHFVDDR